MLEYPNLDSYHSALCGEKLGEGLDRTVYRCSFDERFVIKVEKRHAMASQNSVEFAVWEAVKKTPQARWFAPVHRMSMDTFVLIQEYCPDLTDKHTMFEVPVWLNDTQKNNFGLYKNRIVLRDYGILQYSLIREAKAGKKKIKW